MPPSLSSTSQTLVVLFCSRNSCVWGGVSLLQLHMQAAKHPLRMCALDHGVSPTYRLGCSYYPNCNKICRVAKSEATAKGPGGLHQRASSGAPADPFTRTRGRTPGHALSKRLRRGRRVLTLKLWMELDFPASCRVLFTQLTMMSSFAFCPSPRSSRTFSVYLGRERGEKALHVVQRPGATSAADGQAV